MRLKHIILICLLIPILNSCSGSKKVLSSTENTALFLPPKIEADVDMFIDEVDGKKTKFNLEDSAQVDEGEHSLLIRLEYQPAAGSSAIVGGLGNLLLRSATNKTFSTTMDIEIEKSMEYRFVVEDFDNGFEIILFNETKMKEELNLRFKLNEGKFKQIF
jgi:hypothetical protein